MEIIGSICPKKPVFLTKINESSLCSPSISSAFPIVAARTANHNPRRLVVSQLQLQPRPKTIAILMGAAGVSLFSLVGPSQAAESSPYLNEPSNALSLLTWAVHVSCVVEWATAMALVWQYGEKSGLESWKGLSWGMVPSLGGALCACTWHFFYNSESLEVLVALQAPLTLIGNATMCFAAYRIYISTQEFTKKS